MKKTLSVLVAVIILALSAMPVFAADDDNPSPTASKEYNVIIHKVNGGSGTYTIDKDEDGQHATITAHPKNGYEFVKWIVNKGKYELEDGDLTDEEFTILLKSDVELTPVFKKKGTSSTSSGSTISVSQNQSPTSPKTGDNTMYFVIALSTVAVLGIGALGVKLATGKK